MMAYQMLKSTCLFGLVNTKLSCSSAFNFACDWPNCRPEGSRNHWFHHYQAYWRLYQLLATEYVWTSAAAVLWQLLWHYLTCVVAHHGCCGEDPNQQTWELFHRQTEQHNDQCHQFTGQFPTLVQCSQEGDCQSGWSSEHDWSVFADWRELSSTDTRWRSVS